MILQASFANSLPASDLEQAGQNRCTHCCTRIDVDAELASIVTAWPPLAPQQREALAVMAMSMHSPGASGEVE
jgi:hypothetical protein